MRNRVVWLAPVFLIGFLGLSPSHAQEGVNELTNGGFEEGPSMPLDTWVPGTWNVYGGHTVQVVSELRGAAVPEAPAEGKCCLHVTVPAAGANSWDVGLRHIGHTFKRGKKYTLSVFLKCKSGTLRVNLKTELGEDPWTAYGERQVTMTDKWAEYSTTTPVFATDTTPGTLTFHIAFAAGDFWVDGVRWYEGDYVPPGSPLSGIRTNLGSTVTADGALGDPRGVELDRLIDQLKRNDSTMRAKAASALGRLGDKRAVEPLIAALKDNDARVRMSAALALAALGDKRAVEPLIAALKDEDRRVRSMSAMALNMLGDKRAVEPLIAALKDEDRSVRLSASDALGNLGDKRAFEPLIAALKDTDTDVEVRRMSARALGRLGDQRAFEPLITALKDEDRSVRSSAFYALGNLGDKRAFEPLIAGLKDKDAEVRGSVALALAQLGDERAVKPLSEALRDDDGKVSSGVAIALAQLGDARAVEPLLALAAIPDSGVIGLGRMLVLERMGPPAVEPLIAALKHEDKRVRYIAARVLVQLDDQRAVEPVITFLKSESDALRAPGAKALEATGSSAVEYLIELLKHKELFYVRSSSAWTLGWLGDKRAVEPLVAALGDASVVGNANAGVARVQVALALGRLGDKRSIEPLIRELKRLAQLKDDKVNTLLAGDMTQEMTQDWRRLVVKVLDALVKIGPPALEPLIGVLKDENAHVRSFAVECLGELGDKRAVQPLASLLKDEHEEVRQSATQALSKLGWQPGHELQ